MCHVSHVTCHVLYVKKNIYIYNYIWHVTYYMWHMTRDRWGEEDLLLKYQLPSSYGLRVKVFWRYFTKGWLNLWINEWMTKVIVKQPQLHWFCWKCVNCDNWDLSSLPAPCTNGRQFTTFWQPMLEKKDTLKHQILLLLLFPLHVLVKIYLYI